TSFTQLSLGCKFQTHNAVFGRLLLTNSAEGRVCLFVLSIGPGHKSPTSPRYMALHASGFLLSTSGHSSAIEVEDSAFAQALLSVIIVLRPRSPSGIEAFLCAIQSVDWYSTTTSIFQKCLV